MTTETTIETEVWVPDGDRPGYLKLVRRKSVGEVYDELRAVVGSYPTGGEEYFSVSLARDQEIQWPSGQICVYSVNGSSEGDYVHVDVIAGATRIPVLLAKTLTGRDDSWAFARKLADLLGA